MAAKRLRENHDVTISDKIGVPQGRSNEKEGDLLAIPSEREGRQTRHKRKEFTTTSTTVRLHKQTRQDGV
jgi:hypothetical protein